MKESSYSIRPAAQSDVPILFKMLEDLVQFEGLSDQFLLTETRLETELFGPNADWNCFVATLKDKLIGFCFYSFANLNRAFNHTPMLQIDDLYVCPEHRRANIGHLLIQRLIVLANQNNIERIYVYCLKNNDIGQNFYQKLGGEKMDFLDIYKFYTKNIHTEI